MALMNPGHVESVSMTWQSNDYTRSWHILAPSLEEAQAEMTMILLERGEAANYDEAVSYACEYVRRCEEARGSDGRYGLRTRDLRRTYCEHPDHH